MTRKQFDKLSVKRQRVAIAQDVLERLMLKKFKPIHNIYSRLPIDVYELHLGENTPAQELINQNKCEVCAKGALVMSWAAQFNKKTIGSVLGSGWTEEINAIFPQKMRDAMEAAFEGFDLIISNEEDKEEWKELPGLKKNWSLEKVMKNVVENKGVFKFGGYTFGE